MVGDFQQSIYRDPRDLNHYRALHHALIESCAAEELKFYVTFRLDQAQLDFVNETFAGILNNAEGQVEFRRAALQLLVQRYTKEAGVRSLERSGCRS